MKNIKQAGLGILLMTSLMALSHAGSVQASESFSPFDNSARPGERKLASETESPATDNARQPISEIPTRDTSASSDKPTHFGMGYEYRMRREGRVERPQRPDHIHRPDRPEKPQRPERPGRFGR